jgi:hypothetical protein
MKRIRTRPPLHPETSPVKLLLDISARRARRVLPVVAFRILRLLRPLASRTGRTPAVICRSSFDRGSMIGLPADMTETPSRGIRSDGRVIRCLKSGAFDRRRVPARRVLRPVVHRGPSRARALRTRSRACIPSDHHIRPPSATANRYGEIADNRCWATVRLRSSI